MFLTYELGRRYLSVGTLQVLQAHFTASSIILWLGVLRWEFQSSQVSLLNVRGPRQDRRVTPHTVQNLVCNLACTTYCSDQSHGGCSIRPSQFQSWGIRATLRWRSGDYPTVHESSMPSVYVPWRMSIKSVLSFSTCGLHLNTVVITLT